MNTTRKAHTAAILSAGLLAAAGFAGSRQSPAAATSPHQHIAKTYYNTFSRMHPVLARIRPGDTVATETLDASGRDRNGEVRGSASNPLTGPFYIDGAEAGDTLVVRLTKVRLNRNWGYTAYRLGLYALMPDSIEGLYSNRYKDGLVIPNRSNVVPWDIDITRGTVRLREPASGIVKLEFP